MQAGDRLAHLAPVVGGVPGRQIGAQAERELRLDQAEREVPGRQLGRALVDALPEQATGKRPVDAEQVLDLSVGGGDLEAGQGGAGGGQIRFLDGIGLGQAARPAALGKGRYRAALAARRRASGDRGVVALTFVRSRGCPNPRPP
jgi:hypothetical protein